MNTLELHALKRQSYSLKNEEEIDDHLDNYLAKHGLKAKNIKEREYHFYRDTIIQHLKNNSDLSIRRIH